MATAAELEVLIRGDTRPLDNALNDADTKTKTFAQRMGINQRSVTRFFAGLGAAALAGVGAGIGKAIEFESAFADVRKTVDGTDEELQNLQDTLRDMATDTENPLSALDNAAVTLMNIAAMGGQLGVATTELDEFVQTVGALTVATNMGAEELATFIARFANITGLDSTQYDEFADALVTLGNNMAAQESDIAGFANRLATLSAMNFDTDEILAYSAAMASLGIEAEAGSSSLFQVVNRLTEISATDSDLADFSEALGLVAEDFASLVENNPEQALREFILAYNDLGQQDRVLFLDDFELSGIRVSRLLNTLGAGYETLTDALDLSSEAFQGNGAAMEEAAAKADTTQGRINQFQNNLSEFGAQLGETFLPLVNDVLPRITDFISGLNISEGMEAWESNIDRLGLIFELMLGRTQRGVETWALDLRKRWNDLLQSIMSPMADAGIGVAVDFMAKSQDFEDNIYWEQMAIDFNKSFEERFLGQIVGGDVDLGFAFRGVEFGAALQNDDALAEQLVGQMDSLTQSVVMRALETAFAENDAVSAGGLMELTNLIDPDRTRELLSQELQSAIETGDTALFGAYTRMEITSFIMGDETIEQFGLDLQDKLGERPYNALVDITVYPNSLSTSPVQQAITASISGLRAQIGSEVMGPLPGPVQGPLPGPAQGPFIINSYGQSPLQLNRQLQDAARASA